MTMKVWKRENPAAIFKKGKGITAELKLQFPTGEK